MHETSLWGIAAVVLENERLRATFLAGKGSDLVELNDKSRDLDFAWLSPTTLEATGGFLERYPGGWQEILPNGGAPSHHRGVDMGQHDTVSVVPWEYRITADTEDEVAVRFEVAVPRFPLRVAKTVRLRAGQAALSIEESLVNEAPVPVELMWGQHITFGRPFLRPGCRIRLPEGVTVIPHETALHPSGERRVAPGGPYAWPSVPGVRGGTVDLSEIPPPGEPSEIVYLSGASWYEISDPESDAGLRVEWDSATLPYLWLWQELGATVDFPWWGRAYVVGLEPFSSYPTDGLATAVANGTALTLPGGGSRSLHLTATVIP